MKRKTIKNIILFFLVFLPLQYAFVGVMGVIKGEPWPAFILPAFKTIYSVDNRISVDQMQLYVQNNTEGTVTEINPNKLFRDVDGSQRQGFFRTHFSDSVAIADFSEQARRWLKGKIIQQFPSLHANQLNIRWIKRTFNSSTDITAGSTTETYKQFSIFLPGE